MNPGAVILLGIGLAMDAAAVTAAMGVVLRDRFTLRKILISAAVFGGFQFLMPLLGWGAASMVTAAVQSFGNCVAAALLALIGGKMLLEHGEKRQVAFSPRRLLVLGVATSLDALVAGVSLACLNSQDIVLEALVIGGVTAAVVIAAGLGGRWSGRMLGRSCNLLGGIVLLLLALKALLSA